MKNIWIIQIFAVLHAAVSLTCRALGMSDDMMLTLLTMMMVVILCLRRRTDVVYMTTAVILANIFGFLLGRGFAWLFGLWDMPDMMRNPLSTLICTEIIGFSADRLSRSRMGGTQDARGLRWMLVAFVVIISIRLVLSIVFASPVPSGNFYSEMLLDYIFSCIAILLLAEYAIRLRSEAEKQAETANLAHFKYMTLKQQVNPHFLFNSLNTLDCMIQEGDPSAASEYTHKLADVYRYMIRAGEEATVHLEEEMSFVMKYVDLQRVRFGNGIQLKVDIPEDALQRHVVPCAVQLLVENATKHNAASEEKPLVIDIHTTKSSVVVSNNVQPRITRAESTHLGHKYLRQRYRDVAQKSVIIKDTPEKYTVILPLL